MSVRRTKGSKPQVRKVEISNVTEEKERLGEFVEAFTYGTLKTLIILPSTRNFKLQTGKLRD